jgi:hypothetical protein
MQIVSGRYQNCKKWVVSNQLTAVGRRGDVEVAMKLCMFDRGGEVHCTLLRKFVQRKPATSKNRKYNCKYDVICTSL